MSSTHPGQRGWTAAGQLAPCVICGQPAILRSPRGKPCHWTCAQAWASEHQASEPGQNAPRQVSGCSLSEPCHQAECGACYPDEHQDQAGEPGSRRAAEGRDSAA